MRLRLPALVCLITTLAATLCSPPPGAATASLTTSQSDWSSRGGPQQDDPTSAAASTGSLPGDWRTSNDMLWTLRGDKTGAHLLVARQDEAYAWRTAATLSEPGVETSRWIGNACLTESGLRAVVTYAPREWSNQGPLMLRGGYVAIVDLVTGAVDKLSVRSSLAYFSPGCGDGERAVLTQARLTEEAGGASRTRLIVVNSESGSIVRQLQRPGQITSAIPVAGGRVVAARGHDLMLLTGDGPDRGITTATSVPSFLSVDKAGAVVFLSGTEKYNAVSRVSASPRSRPVELAASRESWLGVDTGTDGRVFGALRDLGQGVGLMPTKVQTKVSSTGDAVMEPKLRAAPTSAAHAASAPLSPPERVEPAEVDEATKISITAEMVRTGRTLDFELTPGVRPAKRYSEGRIAAAPAARAQSRSGLAAVSGTIDPDASCSVPRNDPRAQVYQPTTRQVEWAVDQAIVNNLQTPRPANWKQSGLPSWTPQAMFPSTPLIGGGRVPAQVLLGVLAQESNLWQASGIVKPGVTGNPLVGNFYGRDIYANDGESVDPWSIRWSEADCGYGLGQVTDGMRRAGHARPGETLMSPDQQRAVALDYQTNIAKALNILQAKWNQTKSAGLVHSNADPAKLENWTFAVWAYNSGFYPDQGNGQPWGVGWLNNPANPIYVPNRELFNAHPTDPMTPNHWPYQERVIGWAAYPIVTPDGAGYRAAWWVNDAARNAAQPPNDIFCSPELNDCHFGEQYDPSAPEVDGAGPTPCAHKNAAGQYDLKCWWHTPISYNNCAQGYCGNELKRFNETYPEQPDGTYYPPACTLAGLPSGSWVVDDVPASAASARPGCGHPWTDRGSFTMRLASESARVDLHQIGAGFGGHFWFNHSRTASDEGGRLEATGTWRFDAPLNQWGRVLVHMPDHGAHTQQAAYRINLGNGTVKTRYALQRTRANRWVSLGVMRFSGVPEISLSSATFDGTGSDDVAWDAVAIQPLSRRPRHFVVALGDSYSSGEGASGPEGVDYYEETDVLGDMGDTEGRNACHRSKLAWSRKAVLSDSPNTLGERADTWDDSLDFQFHACSGAQTENIIPFHTVPEGEEKPENLFGQQGRGQYGEMSQIDKGYLDENTTLVTISMGGNDARFADVVTECIVFAGPVPCPSAQLPGETEDMDVTVPREINGRVRRSIERMIYEIAERAPNAKIVLMGYPKLLENDGSCVPLVDDGEAKWLNDMGQVMADMMVNLVGNDQYGLRAAGYQVWAADPIQEFAGQAICGEPETVHGIVMDHVEGDHGAGPSAQSFHPKVSGTDRYRDALQEVLRLPDVGLGP